MNQTSFVFAPFSRRQRMLLDWWTPDSPVNGADGIIADGAIRSGKTMCMSLSFIIWAMSSFDGMQFGMAGQTIGSFRRNVLGPLLEMLPSRGYTVEDRRGDNRLLVKKDGVENLFFIFGGKDEGSQKLVQGVTLAGFFFDEVALMPESFVSQATARCSVDGSKFWFNCNPEGPRHWFKTDWIDARTRRGLLYLHFTMDDNPSLTEHIKERYKGQYTGLFYERFILGRWAVAEGLIYDMFSEDTHAVDASKLQFTPACYVSCDYGTQNACVFLLWQKTTDGVWVCTKEYYYSGRDAKRQKTDAEYAEDLRQFTAGYKPRAVIVDPSAASFIEALRRKGFNVVKAKNDVSNGIRNVSKMLAQKKILFDKGCTHTFAEFALYVWDAKAGEDKPLKVNDHAMDALRYFVQTMLVQKVARVGDKNDYL